MTANTACLRSGRREAASHLVLEWRVGPIMGKKYQYYRDRTPMPGGGFMEAIRIALVEFSCMGERCYDAAGYPHEDERAALSRDWVAIGNDMKLAYQKVREQGVDKNPDRSAVGVEGSRDESAGASRPAKGER